MTEKQMRILSVVATLAAVGMYVSISRKSKTTLPAPRLAVATPRRRHQLHIMVCLRLFERKTRLPHHTGKRPRHYFGFDYIYH